MQTPAIAIFCVTVEVIKDLSPSQISILLSNWPFVFHLNIKNISSSKSRNCQKVSTVLKNVNVVINKMFVHENVLSFSVALLLRGRTVRD